MMCHWDLLQTQNVGKTLCCDESNENSSKLKEIMFSISSSNKALPTPGNRAMFSLHTFENR